MWANIGVPSSDVPAEVELLHMRIERHVRFYFHDKFPFFNQYQLTKELVVWISDRMSPFEIRETLMLQDA